MYSPAKRSGMRTTKPAIGPLTPTSNRIARVGNGSRMRMTAPIVPVIAIGIGMK